MITIEECLSQKLPTRTSLYFKLSSYNQSLFDLLVQTQDSDYNSKTGIFEFPINKKSRQDIRYITPCNQTMITTYYSPKDKIRINNPEIEIQKNSQY